MQVAHKEASGSKGSYATMDGQIVAPHPSSTIESMPPFLLYHEFVLTTRNVSAVCVRGCAAAADPHAGSSSAPSPRCAPSGCSSTHRVSRFSGYAARAGPLTLRLAAYYSPSNLPDGEVKRIMQRLVAGKGAGTERGDSGAQRPKSKKAKR